MATNILTKNNARSTLLSGITSGATNLSVQAGHGARFSAPTGVEIAKLTLYDTAGNIEICHGITRSGDGWSTIVRAQEGTTARAWNAGDGIAENATAAFLNGLSQLDREETATAKKTFGVATAFTLGLGPAYINNIGYLPTVAAKALTVARKTQLLADPTASTPIEIAFRNRTETVGDSVIRQITAAHSVVAPNGASFGYANNESGALYIYECDNGTIRETGLSAFGGFDASQLHNTTAISAAADSATVLYTTTAMVNAAIRLTGRIDITTGAVAGEWDNAHNRVYVGPRNRNEPCAAGYTRTGPGLCMKTGNTSLTGLTRDALTTVPMPSVNARATIIQVGVNVYSAGSVLLRYANVQAYSDGATGVAQVGQVYNAIYEFNATASTNIGGTQGIVIIPGTTPSLKFTDDAGNGGNAGYEVRGYMD